MPARATALIELGDPAGRAELVAYTKLADNLGHARGHWQALSQRATVAQMAGRVDEAIDHADGAVKLGAAIGIPDAFGCHSTLRGSLGALGAPMPPVDALLPTPIHCGRCSPCCAPGATSTTANMGGPPR